MARIVVTEDNSTVYVGDGDTVVIDIPGGGTVTIKAAPGEVVDDFTIEFDGDDHADTAKVDLATFSENDLHIDVKQYDPTDTVALLGAFNKGVDPEEEDEFTFSYVGATGNTFSGYVHAKDGTEKDFTAPQSPINICFGEGTIIDTALGPRPIETLRAGDLIVTQDNGLQPVRWIGKRTLDSIDLARHPHLCPVRVTRGALGSGLPYVDLVLSPQHRLQVSDWRAEFLFAESSVLVAVKHLVDDRAIVVDRDVAIVTYYHLLFDRHEVLIANGAPAESLHTGDMAMQAIDTEARREIMDLFPDLPGQLRQSKTAQRVLRGFEAQAICAYAA